MPLHTILCLGCLVGPQYANEVKVLPINAETIATYEKLEAQYGGLSVTEFGFLKFTRGEDAAAKGLPSFRFITPQDGKLPKFPSVKVPFGVCLYGSDVTDLWLKELKDLKNLTALALISTQVGNTGLKELKDLKNLNSLGIFEEGVTDVGVKELKELKNLSILCLINMKVTDVGLKELKDLKNLNSLSLAKTLVTDGGLKELRDLNKLTSLSLHGRR